MIRYLTRCNIVSSLLSVSPYVDSYMGVHRKTSKYPSSETVDDFHSQSDHRFAPEK